MKVLFKNEFTIALLAALLFIPFIGVVHLFDWDEINFAESAREMIVTGDYFSVQINYQRFFEKPPLFFWLQVLSMKAFGVNEFAARFPNALCGIVTLVMLFKIGKKVFNEHLARFWVLIYLGTFFTFIYFKSGIIDPWFNLFIFLGIYHFYLLTQKENLNRILYAFFTGMFIGLAVLTKGPVAIIISLLVYGVFVIFNRFKFLISLKEFIIITLTIAAISFLWFGIDLIKNGPAFLDQFIQYHLRLLKTGEAGHDEPFFYHWWVLLAGCFPASLFFIQGMRMRTDTLQQAVFKKWMLILFWVTLILFSVVKTKIIHYSSLCWFPLTFLAALCIYNYCNSSCKIYKVLNVLLAIIGSVLSIAFISIPFLMMNKDKWAHKISDVFARGNLDAVVEWNWYDGIGGWILLAGIIGYFTAKRRTFKAGLLFGSVTLCSLIICIVITPKVEAISQRANIEFFKSLQKKDCYPITFSYKSYAPYFYSAKLPDKNRNASDINWLLYGKIDKSVYVSGKIQHKTLLSAIPGMLFLYEKNGFVFFKRVPEN
ncbi:MAG: glycosyltransferase family 39 protein [Ferruginibacter sp.]